MMHCTSRCLEFFFKLQYANSNGGPADVNDSVTILLEWVPKYPATMFCKKEGATENNDNKK